MTAQIFNIRDYQKSKDLARMNKELEQQAVELLNAALYLSPLDGVRDDKKPA